ncbi:YceI family protein [Wohlfahrtiimonas larvae]|uniref:YceI family protein n=1 Tax=Wohlfahrtiimonas larvae TaxID=1157986 RepID=A0ABP9MI33_9GAMM|nr:YceI family protein [Wohlfahrtiimonas larvae]
MKKFILSALTSPLLASISIAADYKLDPMHSNARFNIDHFGTTTNHGGFYGIEGTVAFDPTNKTGAVEVTIPIESLNTGAKDFDNHMKSADLLDIAKFKNMTFKSTEWIFNGDKPTEIKGELTMMGKTNPVTLKATKFNCYENPMFNAEVCGGDFTAIIDRTLWGIDFLVDMGMTKDVVLQIQVEAVKQ